MNDLSDSLSSKAKLFADDDFLYYVMHNMNTSARELNNDLNRISNWAFPWKMSFIPDRNKRAQEVIFIRKLKNNITPIFNL